MRSKDAHAFSAPTPSSIRRWPYGKVAQLAGGLCWFSSVEFLRVEGNQRAAAELVPVEGVEQRLDDQTRPLWQALTAKRASLQLGDRTVRLDQPQVMAVLNVTPDSFSDGGRFGDAAAAAAAGADMAVHGAAIRTAAGIYTAWGQNGVGGDEAERSRAVIRQLVRRGRDYQRQRKPSS